MVTPTDKQTVFTGFTDDPMTVERLCQRTGLNKKRVNDALDELVDANRIHMTANNTWSLRPRKGNNVSQIPTPPSPPTKSGGAKKASATKKAPTAKKAPAAKKEVTKSHSEVQERDDKALALITASKDGLTKDELATAMGVEAGLSNMSVYRLQRDGKIEKSEGKGEGRQVKWVIAK